MSNPTVFGGTLTRIGVDTWQWSDGEVWPCIRDERINGYNFRCLGGYVCVPRRSVAANADLAWVPGVAVQANVEGVDAGRRTYYVPLAVWDARNASDEGVVGCTWPTTEEPAILDKAQDLGWVWPGRVGRSMDASSGTTPQATAAK